LQTVPTHVYDLGLQAMMSSHSKLFFMAGTSAGIRDGFNGNKFRHVTSM
jgi:hypothetical protein